MHKGEGAKGHAVELNMVAALGMSTFRASRVAKRPIVSFFAKSKSKFTFCRRSGSAKVEREK